MVDYTLTTNKAIIKPNFNTYIDDWNTPVNTDWDIIDKAFGGTYTVSLSSSDVTLSQANCQNVHILLTGALSSNVSVNFPSGVSGFFIVDNTTTGAYNITLSSNAGGPYSVLAVKDANTLIWTDGSSVFLADNSPVTGGAGIDVTGTVISLQVPVSVANGGTGQTAFTNGQLLIGNTGTGGLSSATLTAGSNITITNGPGTITIASSGGGGGGGLPNPFAVSYLIAGI